MSPRIYYTCSMYVQSLSYYLTGSLFIMYLYTSTYLLIAANGRANGDWQIEQSARARVM